MVELDPTSMSQAVATGISNAAREIVTFLPNLIIGIIILLVGWVVTDVVRRIIFGVLEHTKIEAIFKKYKVEDALGGSNVSGLIASLARWWVMLFFLQAALGVFNLPALTQINQQVLFFVPLMIGSALLVIVAAVAGEWVREAILGMHRFYLQSTIAQVIKWFIVSIAILTGLKSIGFRTDIVENVVLTLLQGLVYGVAIAFGLAFGLGGQKDASDIIRKARKKFSV